MRVKFSENQFKKWEDGNLNKKEVVIKKIIKPKMSNESHVHVYINNSSSSELEVYIFHSMDDHENLE